MIYVNFGDIRDHLKQNLALQFCGNRNKDISILTETHINFDQIQHIGNSLLESFSPGDSHTKGLLALLHLGFEGVTEIDTDPKGRLVSFKVTHSNDKVLCVYAPSGDSTKGQLARAVSLKDYKIMSNIKMKEMKTK